jgi:hypothetical protein
VCVFNRNNIKENTNKKKKMKQICVAHISQASKQ